MKEKYESSRFGDVVDEEKRHPHRKAAAPKKSGKSQSKNTKSTKD